MNEDHIHIPRRIIRLSHRRGLRRIWPQPGKPGLCPQRGDLLVDLNQHMLVQVIHDARFRRCQFRQADFRVPIAVDLHKPRQREQIEGQACFQPVRLDLHPQAAFIRQMSLGRLSQAEGQQSKHHDRAHHRGHPNNLGGGVSREELHRHADS